MVTPGNVQAVAALARGTIRQFVIPACSLGSEDLRRLHEVLRKRAGDVKAFQVGSLQRQPGQSDEQFQAFKDQVSALLDLLVKVDSGTGDWVAGTGADVLSDKELPDFITSVTYDSAFLFRGQMKTEPQNSFIVFLDFSRTQILDLTNLALGPEQNKSMVRVAGVDSTWVKAVNDDLRNFFNLRKNLRGWIHSRFSYDAVLWLVGFPADVECVYRIDRALKLNQLPSSVSVLLYVLVFLLLLIVFRVLFNYTKWVFPKVEGPGRRAWPTFHRAFVVLIGATLVSIVITAILRIFGIRL